jgi:hypothetical protein
MTCPCPAVAAGIMLAATAACMPPGESRPGDGDTTSITVEGHPSGAPLAGDTASRAGGRAAVTQGEQPFTSILESVTSGFSERAGLVLRTRAGYEETMRTAYGILADAAPPPVDFERDMVIVVAAGERATGGYAVRIDAIERDADGALIRSTVTSPGSACIVSQMLTSPVHVVSTPAIEGAVRFEWRQVTDAC